jgi:hypothetical protein
LYHIFYIFTSYAKTFENQYFNSFSQMYFIKVSTFCSKLFSFQMKVFQKALNTHLYTKQKKIIQESS